MPRNELGAVRSAASAAADDAYEATGADVKGSCQAATSADFSAIVTAASRTITRSTNGAIATDAAYFDGVTLTAGSRALVTQDAFGGASSAYAGIYYVSDAGAAGRPWVLVRAIDADGGGGEVTPGMRTVVIAGALYGSSGFQMTTPASGTIVVGTTPVAFSQYSVSLSAGAGLTRSGRTIQVDQAWDGPTWTGTHIFTDIDVNGGAIDATPIGAASAAAGSFTTIAGASAVLTSTAVGTRGLDITGVANQTSHLAVITGGQAASGSLLVVAQYPNTAVLKVDAPTGLVTAGLVDINGGAIDGTTIGAASAAAGTFTALTCSSFSNTSADSIYFRPASDISVAQATITRLTQTITTVLAPVNGQLTLYTTGNKFAVQNTSGVTRNLLVETSVMWDSGFGNTQTYVSVEADPTVTTDPAGRGRIIGCYAQANFTGTLIHLLSFDVLSVPANSYLCFWGYQGDGVSNTIVASRSCIRVQVLV